MEPRGDNRAKTVQVLLPLPFGTPFDYAVPNHSPVDVGDYVRVPFGTREIVGVVWSDAPAQVAQLKTLLARLDVPPMDAHLRTFIGWVARYTLQPLGAILKLALTVDSAQEAPSATTYMMSASIPPGTRMTPARLRVMAALQDGAARTLADITKTASCGVSVVKGLVTDGVLSTCTGPAKDDLLPRPAPQLATGPVLSPAQQAAADVLVAQVTTGSARVTLLEGVTGSGKTEVFTTAIRAALARGQQVLVMMPEIALSVQMLARFEALLGQPPVLWHSDLATGARRRAWRRIAGGTVQLVLGARSALFLPFHSLGLIVVDEEHDSAYKQEEGTNYHARDLAVVRARLHGIPLILSSATPSVETVVNVQEDRYGRVCLPDRHAGAPMPGVTVVDLLKTPLPRGRWLAESSVAAVRATLARGEQALLFLNRRGYAPLTLCRKCGHRLTCPHCTAWMVEHRAGPKSGALHCHHCGYHTALPPVCPHCGAPESFAACGPGVERIEEEVKILFPDARTLLVASDTLGGWKQAQQALEDVADRKYNLIIGTQMVAKGHHFPYLTCVIVVDADLGLEGGDVRAGERCFQILQQVGGRAGRAERPGSVILQTHCADNFIFHALAKNDRDGFIAHEIAMRARHRWPPFARLAALILSGRTLEQVLHAAHDIREKSPQLESLEIFGPAPAPLARLRDEHRVRLLVRVDRTTKLQPLLADWLARVTLPRGVALKIIIDPFTFL